MRSFLLPFLLLPTLALGQNLDRFRASIDTLCSDYMAGRGYVEEGDRKAADWIAAQYEALDLKPKNGEYFQRFAFSVNTFPKRARARFGCQKLVLGEDFLPVGYSAGGKGKAKLFWLNEALVANPDSLAELLSHQKIHKTAIVAAEADLVTLAIENPLLAEELRLARLWVTPVDGGLLASPATTAFPVPILEVQREDLAAQGKIKFRLDQELIDKHSARNVIGFLPGTEKPDSIVVICAHYDHIGKIGPAIFPGANDNASGVAMLLELASYFSQPENRPRYTLAFICFAAEEAGLLGSTYFVRNPEFPLRQIHFVLNLDLLGAGQEGVTVVNATAEPQAFDLLKTVNESGGWNLPIQARGPAANSDHHPFAQRGVPAFFLYARGPNGGYHNPQDTPDKINQEATPQVFGLLADFVAVLMR